MSNVYQEPKHFPRDGKGGGGNMPLVFVNAFKMGGKEYIDPSSRFTAWKTTSCSAKENKNHLYCRPAALTSPLNSPQHCKISVCTFL